MKGYITGSTSPCLLCTRVQDPRNCENKNCNVWRTWFLARWEGIRQSPRQKMDRTPLNPAGISVGGRTYSHPDQTRTYLQTDPCHTCKCPPALCTGPCRVRRVWEEAKGAYHYELERRSNRETPQI